MQVVPQGLSLHAVDARGFGRNGPFGDDEGLASRHQGPVLTHDGPRQLHHGISMPIYARRLNVYHPEVAGSQRACHVSPPLSLVSAILHLRRQFDQEYFPGG